MYTTYRISVIYRVHEGDFEGVSQRLPLLSDFSHVTAVNAEPFLYATDVMPQMEADL